MGLTYGYDIYLRPGNVARALTALAALAPPARRVPPLELTLPDGERLALPFTSQFKSDPVDCTTGTTGTTGTTSAPRGTSTTIELDTSLMFGVDDVLREYADVYGRDIEEDGRIAIGYVYLTIRFSSLLHPRYASLEFWAATSGMSRVFARSPGVREVFTDLTAAAGGVCCLFDTGDGSPGQLCWLNGEATEAMVPVPDPRALAAKWPDPSR
ncbi:MULTISPECIES: hypothetical protein [unclassified Streptomyces]|uniref:hypothetical protein n=1 Tax=unclassified Streptomyces TaxID=2593676 RepID=UPI000C084589|nr:MULTISPECIES: hypothetical protein [unclassified Streptomyces]MYQ40788.1 hypothetical protein [Streptomyces sp. SID4921]